MRTIVHASVDNKLVRVERYARLATAAYEPIGAASTPPANFVLLDNPKPDSSWVTGFLAKTYKDAITGEILVTFAGTDWKRVGTLITDVALMAGDVPRQFVQAETYVKTVRAAYPDAEIILVGHSLGGALAIFVAQRQKLNAIAFNAPFLNDKLWAAVPSEHRQSFRDGPWYMNFQSTGMIDNKLGVHQDVVSTVRLWTEAAVEVVGIKTGCGTDLLCHSIERFLVADPAAKQP